MKKIFSLFALLLVFISAFPAQRARADVAPPETPPGTNLLPGDERTQVRMQAETVTLIVSENPADATNAIAKTEAVFTMRNLGTAEEKMQVRFPLSFFDGASDGFGRYPEISAIVVKIDGKTVTTRRENQPFFNWANGYTERDELPWAVFDVTFPPNQDVKLEVFYTAYGFGYYPYETFKYVLQTGAGWNGTIGSADIIVRLPYQASEENIYIADEYSQTSSGGILSGNEIRWHFEDLEPTWQDDLQVTVVTPQLWQAILKDTASVEANPKDGEAWGRLGKSYKEIIRATKGWLRDDLIGREMFEKSKSSYEKCLALLPNDALWRYGYADLLWSYYYYQIYLQGEDDTQSILPIILTNLQSALALDPNNTQAKELLAQISYSVPGAVSESENGFDYLGLTATPLPPTPTATVVPTVALPTPTPELSATIPAESMPEAPTVPKPLCGSAALLPALFGLLWFVKRKR